MMTDEDMFAAWAAEMDAPDTSDVVDLSQLTTAELLVVWTGTEAELLATGHAIWPVDQDQRDLTSVRQAAMLLFKKRTGTYPEDFPDAPEENQ